MPAGVHGPGRSSGTSRILVHGQIGKNLAAFGNIADAGRRDAKRRPARCVRTEDGDVAFAGRREAHEATQRRGFAGAVAAQQCRHLALGGFKADAVQDVALAVKCVEAFGYQGCGHAACPR